MFAKLSCIPKTSDNQWKTTYNEALNNFLKGEITYIVGLYDLFLSSSMPKYRAVSSFSSVCRA